MKAVITAGGKGSRISALTNSVPKPMLMLDNKPILEHQINCLKHYGFKDIIITVGHMSNKIIEYFKNGNQLGVKIEYYLENKPLGNAGALYKIPNLGNNFLLINGDLVFNCNLSKMVSYHFAKNAKITLFTHPNNHPFDSSLLVTNKKNKIVEWINKDDKKPIWYKNKVNAGIHVLSKEVLKNLPNNDFIDLDKDIIRPQVKQGGVYSYCSSEYIKDMGTPQRYKEICEDYRHNIINSKNLDEPQKAIFLDRDGTINKYAGHLNNINNFELIEGVTEAIRIINLSGYLVIVVSNQPVVARGEITFEELDMIHNKMETLLGNEGAYVDGIYICPHHPDKGFPGEVKELKIECTCRKPKDGLLIEAAKDFNIDLTKSWMIGDSDNDIIAGKHAGCNTFKVDQNHNLLYAINQIIGAKIE